MMDYFCYVWLVEGGEAGRSSVTDEEAIDTLARIWFNALWWKSEGAHGTTRLGGRTSLPPLDSRPWMRNR